MYRITNIYNQVKIQSYHHYRHLSQFTNTIIIIA